MALDNVLALFLLPIIGAFSDRVSTRLGKRMPFIIGGTISAVILMMAIPFADNQENFILFFIILGLVLVAMSFYRSPAVALMPDLTPKELRSKANAVINLMGAAGGIFTLVAISLFIREGAKPDYTYVFLAVAILMVVTVAILFITIRENHLLAKIKEQERKEQLVEEQATETDSLVEETLPKDVKKSLFLYSLRSFYGSLLIMRL